MIKNSVNNLWEKNQHKKVKKIESLLAAQTRTKNFENP
jgi:hypothetical protein